MVQMMQKASQMKKKMQEMQERVRAAEVTGEAPGGVVVCRMTGGFEVKAVTIDPALVNPDDIETLEDMTRIAVNNARAQAERLMGEETQKIMSDLGLPPGLGLPF